MTMVATKFIHSTIDATVPRVNASDSPVMAELRKLVANIPGDKLSRLNEALPASTTKMELVDVLNVMARLGFEGAPLDLRLRDIDPRLLPCLFVSERTRRIQAVTEPTRARTRGTAYVFNETSIADLRSQREAATVAGGWFRQLMMRFRPLLWRVAGIALVHSLVAIGLPLFLMVIYDRLTDLTSVNTIHALGVGAFIVLFIQVILRLMQSRMLSWLSARIDYLAGTSILSRLLQLPAHAVERASVASQISRLKVFESVGGFFSTPLFITLLDLPFSLLALIVVFIIAGPLGFIPLGVIAALGLLGMVFIPRLRLGMFHAANGRAAIQAYHVECFERLQSLRVNGMSEIWTEQYRDISARGSLMAFRSQFIGHVLDSLAQGLVMLGGVAVIYAGVGRVWDGAMSGGALFAAFLLSMRVTVPWRTLCGALPRLEQLRRSIEQIDRLMHLETERLAAKALSKPGHVQGAIAFNKVGLRYKKDGDPVFIGLSFSMKPGEMLAIAGGNGTGKSTILKLAMGLYRPQAGAITLDGRDIRQIDPMSLRHEFAYVPQIPELFDGTIAENVRFGNPNATDADILRALDIVDMENEAASMPQGLDTRIRTGGEALPASLAYRIVLARAYVRDTAVMLFDELPPAVLNSETGRRFIERLRAWHGGKTILLVTHRNDLVRMADRAVGFLNHGRIIVDTPEQVIQKLRDETLLLNGRLS